MVAPRFKSFGRALAAIAVTVAIWVTTMGAGRVEAYTKPATLPALSVTSLAARYMANRRAIEQALKVAERTHDHDRATAFGRFLKPGRNFLFFDPQSTGQAVEAVGDLTHAKRVAILVPGADTSVNTFDMRGHRGWATPGGGARELLQQAKALAAKPGLAVVAWLGYLPPKTISPAVVVENRADEGASRLREFVTALHRLNPGARTTLLCHSYGSVVCGEAVRGLPVSEMAAFGSPGLSTQSVAGLGTRAKVWAGRGREDWMSLVPHVHILGMGFGADPVSPSFGARLFAAGDVGHSDYLKPGSTALRNLALIALGRDAQVTTA